MESFYSNLDTFKERIASLACVSKNDILVSIDGNKMEIAIVTRNLPINCEAVVTALGNAVISDSYDVITNRRTGNVERVVIINLEKK